MGAPPKRESERKHKYILNKFTDALSAKTGKKTLDPARPAPRGSVRGALGGGEPLSKAKTEQVLKKKPPRLGTVCT